MPRITEYAASTNVQGKPQLADSDVFALDGTNGVRKINANKLAEALSEKTLHAVGSTNFSYGKNGIYRGANLGSGSTFAEASTPAQRTAIQNGTFDGLFIGDYWTVNGKLYRIADFNYWKGTGDTTCSVNHLLLVPDEIFGSDKMNSSNITTGAYINTYAYTDSSSLLNQSRTSISSAFGSYLLTHRSYLPNSTSDGAQNGGAWYNSTVELMNEIMVAGVYHMCAKNNDTYIPTVDKCQLAMFRLNPSTLNFRRQNYWLRDVYSSTQFVDFNSSGAIDWYNAGVNCGIRPVFAVKGTTT